MEEGAANQEAKAELGRRILAALMSYQLHLKSPDYTMKTYLSDKEVDPSWGELGWALLEMMNDGLAERNLGPALRTLTAKIQ
ncbi:MAG TPA: hypothetical protein VEK84_18590 [Terriglobales bacterium]|nr:hypothetical protein [Terriglobales bacterium]